MLHWQVRNYSLSTNYFQKRYQHPFENSKAKLLFLWTYARSAFYSNQHKLAYEIIKEASTIAHINGENKKIRRSVLEKMAFYAMSAEDYKGAIEYYQDFIKDYKEDPLLIKTQVKLALGFCFFMLKEYRDAKKYLADVVKLSQYNKIIYHGKIQLMTFYPEKLLLIALGLLDKCESKINKSIEYRKKRHLILQYIKDNYSKYDLDFSEVLIQILYDLNRISFLYQKDGQDNQALEYSYKAIKAANVRAEYNGKFLRYYI